jgi:hypothetical protein
MTAVNVTRLISTVNLFDLSHSIAEGGKTAGADTWNAAKTEATETPLAIDDREGVKQFFAGFGAWDREEIAAWSAAELDALVLQYAAGDLREVQDLCPGDGLGDIDWTEAEELSHADTIGGRLYPSGDQLFIDLSE